MCVVVATENPQCHGVNTSALNLEMYCFCNVSTTFGSGLMELLQKGLSAVLSPKEHQRPDSGLVSFPGLPSLQFGMAQSLHTTSIVSFPGSPH